MKNLANNFVLSRAKISNSSIQVGDLYITPNFDENISDEILSEVESIVRKNFTNVRQLNGKSVKNLRHLFEDNVKTTQFFMGALTLLTIDKCKFYVVNNKTGILMPTISVLEVQFPTAEEEKVEAPVVEAPVVEEVEAPVVEAPVVEAPVVEAPVVEAPVVEAPVVEAPVVEAVKTEETKAPVVKPTKPTKVVTKNVADAQKQNAAKIEESLK